MGLLLIFQTEQNPNEKRDKPKKEDLSRCIHPIELFSKQSLTFLRKFVDFFWDSSFSLGFVYFFYF